MSLLDYFSLQLSRPPIQRAARLSLAGFIAMLGVFLRFGVNSAWGYFVLIFALGVLVWGFMVHGADIPVPLDLTATATPENNVTPSTPLSIGSATDWFTALRLPAILFIAVFGQMILTYQPDNAWWGVSCFVFALIAFGLWLWRAQTLTPPKTIEAHTESPLVIRWWLAPVIAIASGMAFFGTSDNHFTLIGVIGWVVSVGAWLAIVWEGNPFTGWRERVAQWLSHLQADAVQIRLSWTVVLLIGIITMGAYFRYTQLDAIPPEMTSDHVEKLLDVSEIVLNHKYFVYFERNTGREPLQFYAAALVYWLLGTGLTHLTLKIVTATAGVLTIPFVFWLGREIEDDTLGLIAAFLVAVSFWAEAISRVGLRFPLYPLFTVPTILFLLRGLRRGSRNDFLLAGVSLGIGLFGYSPFRVVPVLVVITVLWFLLTKLAKGRRLTIIANTILLASTAFIIFLPLFRYSLQKPDMFWYRTASRLTSQYSPVSADTSPVMTFLTNQWNALLMFNWRGDLVWVNTLPGKPTLDVIVGGLFILGVLFALARFIIRRDWVAGLMLIAIPILMLPSTLAIAFPEENPSIVRASGAYPLIYLLAAYPLWLLVKQSASALKPTRYVQFGVLGALLLTTTFVNHQSYFVDYPQQFIGPAQNASEIGGVIKQFAQTVGSYETAYVRPYPYWVDTRAVGMYAGDFGRDFAILFTDLGKLQNDPRPKLFILHKFDYLARPDPDPPTLAELQRLYPTGAVSVFHSVRPGHDFLMYFVPGNDPATVLPTP